MSAVLRQSRIEHLLDGPMAREKFRHLQCSGALCAKPQRQRCDTAPQQPAIERRQRRAGRALPGLQALEQRAVLRTTASPLSTSL